MYRSILVMLLNMSVGYGWAQTAPPIEWQRSLGGSERDFANSVQPTADGGYIIAGTTSSSNGDVVGYHGGPSDAWVVKLDAVGMLEWQRTFGGPGSDEASAVKQTSDGGYIVAAASNANGGDVTGNHGNWDLWVFKLDMNGVLEWQKSYGGSNEDSGNSVELTGDGGYIIAGETRSADGDVTNYHGASDCWLVKIDGNGDLQWQHALGGSGYDGGFLTAHQNNDGGYVMVGSSGSADGDVTENQGNSDLWVVKVDDSGQVHWQRSLGGSLDDNGFSILQIADGSYIAAGYSLSNDGDVSGNHGAFDYWVVKLGIDGTLQWQKCLGGTSEDSGLSMQQTSDGGYVLTGWTQSDDGQVTGYHGGQFGDAWVVRLDPDGELLWEKTIGGSATDRAFDIQATADGGYILTGMSNSNDGDITGNHGGYDAWIVKLGPDDVGIAENEATAPFTLYPNPATDAVTISFDRASTAPVQLQIYDAAGRSVRTELETTPIMGERDVQVFLGDLPAGIYELRLNTGGQWYARRLVKL